MNIQAVEDEEVLQGSALSMAYSIVNPSVLKCALRLKIPDIIWKAGHDVALSVHQIASQLPSEAPDVDALCRILTYLSTMGILQTIKPTEGISAPMNMKYALTNLTKTYFISQDINSLSLVPFVLLQTHPVFVAAWDHIHERVLHGGDNFKNSSGNGKDFWNFAASDPEFNAIFNAGMVSLAKVGMTETLATYDGFKDINTLVDLVGGHGEVLSLITAAYPHIHAIIYDLPHVIATAPALPGIQHISGNPFESVPSADAIFMKHFLHIWDDELCIKLLNNCYQAVPHKGKLIIAEAVLDITDDSDMIGSGKVIHAFMLNLSSGGRERTREQWNELLKAAGFSLSKIVGKKGTLTKIIEAIKC